MLVKVVARSRPEAQFVENTEGPKGLEEPRKLFDLWGIDPARSRDKTAVLGPGPEVAVLPLVSMPDNPGGRNGLVDGVGLEVLEMKDCGWEDGVKDAGGGNRDGTVPALALRAGLLNMGSEGMRLGNSSWFGDSGMFSRSGVE